MRHLRSLRRALVAVALALCCAAPAAADPGWYPGRRRSQFPTDPGYAVLPYAYNLPGIGWGYGLLGGVANIAGTPTDVSGTLFGGDVEGAAAAVDSIHLVPRRLVLDLGGARVSDVTIQVRDGRGMSSGADEYTLASFSESAYGGGRLTATFLERRLELYLGHYAGGATLSALRQRDGEVLVEAEGEPRITARTTVAGARLDLTDDALDPRRGVRLDASLWRTPPRELGPDFYLVDVAATAWLPVGRRSTWAFTYFHSSAHVLEPGETDPAAIERELGLDCAGLADPGERARCGDYVESVAAQNRHGTATALGGVSRLRSYPEQRFTGARVGFAGTELRWNLTDESTPFDILVARDIRTSVQVALFYEIGSVVDPPGDLWGVTRSSWGAGVRVVTASGIVYRFDLAAGSEGVQPSIFFQYPWELF